MLLCVTLVSAHTKELLAAHSLSFSNKHMHVILCSCVAIWLAWHSRLENRIAE